ncbi:hypothetical protein HBI56_086100 [Parastagonospora nodorum]|uniref:Uncharacterized protein n=1 Tax=Phaeosphaeria nodorum (strain SN15 / ATCC MYA-4574 / FGSC 10173) TaxID=321614 RepID=A0A7U2FE47_PHANO|nr:hypothetical protein HBH56_113450 [Parastagonospora nodorum]QRD03587.1 hypothetical protein JI435_103410 [Parastagonospora nodorum SN15]KAH3921503.1 hypothetical protein HBH54_238970 [Parastagonospora nodorum]KAH3951132.1 hypothetical protein HBH53_069130 [Parastagonospora nodorum]KAH3963044.1 hypothetical protein HBH51_169800 [Parastagonospora nodorum]
MAPHQTLTESSWLESWTLLTVVGIIFRVVLLFSVFAAVISSFGLFSTRRKKMLVQQNLCQEKMSIASLVIRGKLPPSTQPEEQNQRLKALKEELSHAEYIPIYPWIAPPTPLPGPYDAPYYPLPSIRKYSHDSSTTESPPPEELQSVSYTRRLPTNSTSGTAAQEPVLHGTTTVSNHGWRRTQWTISKG